MKFNRRKFARLQAFRLLPYAIKCRKAKPPILTEGDIEWLTYHLEVFDEFHLVEAIKLIHAANKAKGESLARQYRDYVAPSLRCACANILGEEP